EVFAVGHKNRPAVGLMFRRSNALGGRRRPRPIGINAPHRTFGARGIDDYTFASPTAATSSQNGSEHLRRAPRDRHFLQLAVGKKSDISTIGRPEGITCALSARQQ